MKWFPEKSTFVNRVSVNNPSSNLDNPSGSGEGGSVVITVTDTGPGLSQNQLGIICTEGVQFNPNELQAGGGSGLGLWISRQIVDLHGGVMTVSSPGLGQGASFEIKLPLIISLESNIHSAVRTIIPKSSIPPNSQTHEEGGVVTPQELGYRPNRILIVDDAPSIRKMLGRILKSNNICYEEAENGQICVDKISEGAQFDLILLDYEMPVLNGPKTAKILRELGTKTFIIGVTGNVLPEDTRFFLEHGADAVLPKPLTLNSMLEVYDRLMVERNSSF